VGIRGERTFSCLEERYCREGASAFEKKEQKSRGINKSPGLSEAKGIKTYGLEIDVPRRRRQRKREVNSNKPKG